MCLQLDCKKLILMGHQSCLQMSLALFLITPFGALIPQGLLRNEFNVEIKVCQWFM